MTVARKIISARWLPLLLVAVLPAAAMEQAGVLATHSLASDSIMQWRLPSRLREISGLALDADERLFAVADEKAVIYELDLQGQEITKAFALGRPVQRGDFEGLAIVGADFYLITSDGRLFRAAEGADGDQVAFEVFDTGLGRQCEIEGLATAREHLLIACKRMLDELAELQLFAWSLAAEAVDAAASVALPRRAIARGIGKRRVNPSGIAIDPLTGNLLLVAARQRALIELTAAGKFVAALRLPLAGRHRQPEGVELLRDGSLLLADEGGNHKPRLAVYRRDTVTSGAEE